MEQRWKNYRNALIENQKDGQCTLVDIGHLKIMVNSGQKEELTLERIFAL
jgi:hypothetical protein